tara:strand:- start:557 stop:841 length:285 start_codon:yes stop_codon:yes gene_type:complete
MKLKTKVEKEPDIGAHLDLRLRKMFLLFPKQLGNDRRWLETVYVVQRYRREYASYDSWESQNWIILDEHGFIKPEDYPAIVRQYEDENLIDSLN